MVTAEGHNVAGGHTALIALRAKSGECAAIRQGSPQLWRRVQPLIDLDDGNAATQLDRVEAIAQQLGPHGRHLMIDVGNVRTPSNFGPTGPLAAIVDRLEMPATLFDSPVPIIPVVRDDASEVDAANIARLSGETGVGLALRIRATGTGAATAVAHLVETMKVDTTELDVIIDRRYVDRVRPELTELVLQLVDTIRTLGPTRSVALLSGSVPKTFNRTSWWEQPRYEELLWQEISVRSSQRIRLGDYGVVHPVPTTGFRSNHVNVKYSCDAGWFFGREPLDGAADPDDDAESGRARTFRRVSRHLVDNEHFAGSPFSWGDDQFVLAANGHGTGLGSTSKPVAFATSHHLAYLAARQ